MNRLLTLAAALFLAAPALAHEVKVGDLEIIHPHIPQPAENAMAAGGFMAISNNGTEADRLIGIEADFAAQASLHESKVDANGVGTMARVDAVEIPVGETVNLEHGGYHIMFMGLNTSFTEGQMVKVTLVFEHAGRAEVEFMVDPPGEDGGHAQGDHSAMMVEMTGDPMADIAAVMKAQFDTPENPLTVDPISVQGEVAIAGWAQGDKGGRAFLRMSEMGWSIEVCAGSGLLAPEMLTGLGLSEADAATLLATVNAAEAELGADAIALFDSFDGEMFFTE